MDSTYLFDEFTTLTAGEGFKLFPFGRVYKGGKAHDITPEFAKTIKLPHFTAPIKLGSHEDTTPAGGFITALEVREDGLYAIPEWNEAGKKAIENGAFRFNSPEIIWEGGLENPKDGSVIRAPLIVGDALLHTPHLGKDTALYSVEAINKENDMEENITVPKNLWDKFTAFIDSRLSPPEPQTVEIIPDEYKAAKIERDELKNKIAEREQAEALKVRIDKFESELKETKADPALAAVLADLPEEKAGEIMKQFRALSAQIGANDALIEERGAEGSEIEDPKAVFNALVLKYSAEKKVDYNTAFEITKTENADLFVSAFAKKEK